MANNSNKKLVPEAMDALDRFKYEVASDDAVKNLFEQYYLKLLHFFLRSFLVSVIYNFRFFYYFIFFLFN